jgi:hypothetical protein
MSNPVTSAAATSRYQSVCSAEQASAYTAAEIREAIAYWVAHDRLDIADALVAAGMGLYPDSPDILAIAALLAEINQDWAQAQTCLEHLIEVQAEATTGESWFHLVRVMRCREAFFPAMNTARQGLSRHPEHAGLQQEHHELSELLKSAALETPKQAVAC